MGGWLIKCLTIFYGGRVNKVTSLYFMGGGLIKDLTIFYGGGRINKVPHYIFLLPSIFFFSNVACVPIFIQSH